MSASLHEIKIQTIDFEWIKSTTKLNHLKRAIRIIQQDGNYYTELKDACYARMEEIDPTCKRILFDNNATSELKQVIKTELEEWENTVQNKQGNKELFETNLEDYQKYFDNETNKINQKKKIELAEKERTKGNEAIKSKDFDEAIAYYTKSIELDKSMYQSYGNRALAFLKKKQFNKCLEDCQKAISLNKSYTKAYHRKAKALVGLRRKVEAYRCLKEIIKLEPQNNEINKQIMELRQEMSQAQISQLESSLIPKSQFKKITIEEDSDQEIQEV